MIMIDIIKLPPEHYLQLIRNNKPFSFSRFGDGEALCMFHSELKSNCDGSYFLDELIEPMKQIFKNQYDYYHCLLYCSFTKTELLVGDQFKDFIEETCPNMQFFLGEVWQELSFNNRILELTNAISDHRPCFIGGKHIKNVKFINGFKEIDFIEIPSVDAFKEFDKVLISIQKKYNDGCRMFCFCAGYSTKIWIDKLFPVIGHNTFMIDFGSVFDPYCGKLSRNGHRLVGFEKWQPFTKLKLV